MMHHRFQLIKDLLADSGALFVHLDWHVGHYIKVILDEIFGENNFRNQIIWHYPGREMHISNKFNAKHDIILFYAKSDSTKIRMQNVAIPYDRDERIKGLRRKVHKDPDGKEWVWETRGQASGQEPYKRYIDEIISQGKPLNDVWADLQFLRGNHPERVDYATQKPAALVERIIKATTDEGALVADFFCGSGTTLAASEKLNRRWIGTDLSRYAIHTTRKRLMEIPECKPFEILNLGRYERQVWQGVTFDGQKHAQQMLIFEYLKFILELYGAQPLAGTQVLHGKKGSAVVHVGAVDAPVTIDEVIACLAECKQMKQKELHILGWEWEMGLANLMVDEAKGQGVKLLMLTIPREVMEQQAVQKGDIHFYELAYLETEIKVKERGVTVALTDFVIPNDELIPPDVRQKIKKWSDYVDYWAIDWDFQNDAFVNGWTSYRTRKERALLLKSETHEYPAAGKYRVVVKAIDIFGNDTSQVFEVEVK